MPATGLDPEGLLDAAGHLVPAGRGRPRAPRLRRAISTAYYAAFTALTQEVAHHHPAGSVRQSVQRLVSHAAARRACIDLRATASVPWLRDNPPCHSSLLHFAENFEALARRRMRADYDHEFVCTKSDATDALALARQAVDALSVARRQCPEQLDIACVAALADDRRRRYLSKPRTR